MLVTSKITGNKYQWIKVPRTGTISYSAIFDQTPVSHGIKMHRHHVYNEFYRCNECTMEFSKLKAFTLVRNPVSRFKSSMNFMVSKYKNRNNIKPNVIVHYTCEICKKVKSIDVQESGVLMSYDFINFYKNEDVFYDFMYGYFDKNCELKSGYTFSEVFGTQNPAMISSFFLTQVHWAYNPFVKFFKYEFIKEYNNWIEMELGYDTSTLKRVNASSKKIYDEINIDFESKKFKELVKYLFEDDFRYFNYEFPV